MRRWRATWSRWDWAGAVVLGVGAVIAVVAFLGHRSDEWSVATTLWKGRMVEYGSWAGGAFAIGIGVLPAIALLAMLAVPRAERDRPGVRAFVVVAAGAVVGFGWYAAVKGAYLSTTFSSLIVERNLVYLTPLAFVATAYLLERATAPVWAVLVAGAAVLGLVVWVPIERGLDNFPYYEAHGLAILALANREWAWPVGRIETAVEVLTVAAAVLLLLVGTRLRSSLADAAAPVAVAVAVALLVWNVTAEIYASIGEHDFSALVEKNIAKPNDWVDRGAGSGHGDDARAAHERQPARRAVDRVLEPVDLQGVERRRHGPRAGAHADARPPGRGRNALAQPADRLRACERWGRGRRRRGRRERRDRRSSASTAGRSGCARTRRGSPVTAGSSATRATPASRRGPRTTGSTCPTAGPGRRS